MRLLIVLYARQALVRQVVTVAPILASGASRALIRHMADSLLRALVWRGPSRFRCRQMLLPLLCLHVVIHGATPLIFLSRAVVLGNDGRDRTWLHRLHRLLQRSVGGLLVVQEGLP